jgi:hypothetical protein
LTEDPLTRNYYEEEGDNLPPMTDTEALDILEYFRSRSLSKGYIISPDFEELMEAIYIATTWYHQKLKDT